MPAKSDAQRKAAGAALSAKRKGSSKNLKDASRSMHDSMTEDELEDFATEKTHLESYPNPGEAQGKGAFSSANSSASAPFLTLSISSIILLAMLSPSGKSSKTSLICFVTISGNLLSFGNSDAVSSILLLSLKFLASTSC